jgi:hypothetical protein
VLVAVLYSAADITQCTNKMENIVSELYKCMLSVGYVRAVTEVRQVRGTGSGCVCLQNATVKGIYVYTYIKQTCIYCHKCVTN